MTAFGEDPEQQEQHVQFADNNTGEYRRQPEQAPRENLAFTHSEGFGLPNYFGDIPGHTGQPQPVDLRKEKKAPNAKSVKFAPSASNKTSDKKPVAKRPAKEWNDSTTSSRFFDKKLEKDRPNRPQTAKNFESRTQNGKTSVALYSKGGRQSGTFDMVRDIDEYLQNSHTENTNTYSMKNNRVELERLQKEMENGRAA